jgi:predicted dehydrogenase
MPNLLLIILLILIIIDVQERLGLGLRLRLGVTSAIFLLPMLPAKIRAQEVRLITLDPGHFHASLMQKFMYPQVDPVVHVYAPAGPDLQEHLKRIEGYNARADNPTHWQEDVYSQPDFLEQMVRQKAGNVVVLAGNNLHKTDYIDRCIKAGFNVLADKPMAITPKGFKPLRKDLDLATRKKLLLYDIMTERHEITTILQRELARMPEVFGTLAKGDAEHPAVEMKSVHCFYKEVSGKPLIRPGWFFDVKQEGEAIQDVGTHLVDLVQWECFPDRALDWKKDVQVHSSKRWATPFTPEQFQRVTGLAQFPDYLKRDVGADGKLQVFQNGDVNYTICGVAAKVTALWKYEAPAGGGDTHYSKLIGSRAVLTIEQGEAESKPQLYVEDVSGDPEDKFEGALKSAIDRLSQIWPGVEVQKAGTRWRIVVPDKYRVGHEAHFAQVTEEYLHFLAEGKMPDWVTPNILAKYYTTTEAWRIAHAGPN